MNAIAFRRRPAVVLLGLAPVLVAGTVFAQTSGSATAPTPTTTSPSGVEAGRALTRNLNAAPPTSVVPVSPAPQPQPQPQPPTAAPAATSSTPPATARPATPQPAPARITPPPAVARPTPAPAPAPTPAPTRPAPTPTRSAPPAVSSPPTVSAAPSPRPATVTPPASGSAPVYAPPRLPGTSGSAASAPAAPPVSAPANPAPAAASGVPSGVLAPAAVAALPFRLDLPQGFSVTRGRPGPDFDVYSVRRGERSFVMIYTGPSSQFPIYTGETVQAGGRASIVVTENGQRHAMEHLFQRETAPREIHVWVASLEGADAAMAERIAQSVDPR